MPTASEIVVKVPTQNEVIELMKVLYEQDYKWASVRRLPKRNSVEHQVKVGLDHWLQIYSDGDMGIRIYEPNDADDTGSITHGSIGHFIGVGDMTFLSVEEYIKKSNYSLIDMVDDLDTKIEAMERRNHA